MPPFTPEQEERIKEIVRETMHGVLAAWAKEPLVITTDQVVEECERILQASHRRKRKMIDRLKQLWPFSKQWQPTRRRPTYLELSVGVSGALMDFVEDPTWVSGNYSLETFFAGPFRDRFMAHLSKNAHRGERLVDDAADGIYFERR